MSSVESSAGSPSGVTKHSHELAVQPGDLVYYTDPIRQHHSAIEPMSDLAWYWKVELARIRDQPVPDLPDDFELAVYVGDRTCEASPLCNLMSAYHHMLLAHNKLVIVSERTFVIPSKTNQRLKHFNNTTLAYLDDYRQ